MRKNLSQHSSNSKWKFKKKYEFIHGKNLIKLYLPNNNLSSLEGTYFRANLNNIVTHIRELKKILQAKYSAQCGLEYNARKDLTLS